MSEIMSAYELLRGALRAESKSWLITGVAGFIGSNLLEELLKLDQTVVGLDNFSTGYQSNLDAVREIVSSARWERFRFINDDICNLDACLRACDGVDYVLHQAAIGSVPRSIADPITTNATNVTGFLNMMVAARDAKVANFVFAASSSTYGDHPALPKIEDVIGNPLSPYAVTKYVNELYANVFARSYGFQATGLRYFNVFGPRQDPGGTYAAVIPKWTDALINGREVTINGDGETSRDFCFVANAVQANLLAATTKNPNARNQVYNVAVGERTTLNELYAELRRLLVRCHRSVSEAKPVYAGFRQGDVRHSLADISKARSLLGYSPTHRVREGLALAMPWYKRSNNF